MPTVKDTTGIEPICPYISYEDLQDVLCAPEKAPAPLDNGTLSLIVLRPQENERRVVDEVEASVEFGIAGSGWTRREERGVIDQVCVMPTASIKAIAGTDPSLWPPAGDQLFMDLDLGKDNLKPGDIVAVGRDGIDKDVLLQVTTKPHNGCAKFAKRYGPDSLKLVNSPTGKQRRLRGIYFHVVRPGTLRAGDKIVKVDTEENSET